MRYSTKKKTQAVFGLIALVLAVPLATSFPVIAGVAVLHHNWWPTIPLMHYWTAYLFQVAVGGVALVTVLPVQLLLVRLR